MATTRTCLQPITTLHLGSPIGQLRAAPVQLGPGAPRAVLATYCADFDVDPYTEMFFFPTDTLKMVLFTEAGEAIWRRDLGPAVVPGMWFCPVLPFDLDGDGRDEIWFVNNLDPKHPLGTSSYRLERLDALTGRTTGQWVWPDSGGSQPLSHMFRNFIVGGSVRGEPALVTVQGTYDDMFFQAWKPDMTCRWQLAIGRDAPGARGSHMCPITDLDQDGVEELMWGERCIELDTGTEVFCADRDCYRGHSDVVQPIWEEGAGRWFLYTCRESDPEASPRVVLYDDRGARVWGHVDRGHIDMGWVARLAPGGERIAAAIRIGNKTCGPDGRFHQDMTEFTFDALTGKDHPLPFSIYQTLPVDINGDGLHELVRGMPGGNGEVLDGAGRVLGSLGGPIALASKISSHPGEQVLTYQEEGTVRIWADREAEDSPAALARYRHPFYRANQRLSSSGSNLAVLGGL